MYRTAETEFFTGRLDFPVQPSLGVKEAMAARVVPHQRQLEWQQLEMTAFLHFTVNTFTGLEWGTGKESPELFNPILPGRRTMGQGAQ